MKVLVVGGGGREHALVWKIAQSPKVTKIYCAPGNAGIAGSATCIDIASDDINGLKKFAADNAIGLTVVGPELPLTMGIVDSFEKDGLRIFGPNAVAARLEGSKKFAKEIMQEAGIPTADFAVFTEAEAAKKYIRERQQPLVVKADGLAAGKGVFPCRTAEEAAVAVDRIITKKEFGDAGTVIVIEDFLEGEEASFICFTDGTTIVPLPSSQDHKRIFDNDTGPNTGGMGAYSPAPVVTPEVHERAMETIMKPLVAAFAAKGIPFKGIVYAGLMIKDGIPRVLEFNMRMGDPETQPILFRITSDLVELMDAAIDGRLGQIAVQCDPRPAACVVMAAGGYPDAYAKGCPIRGLEEAACVPDTFVFHAGTALKNGVIVTSGGRVLGVTARGTTIEAAVAAAYRAAGCISWEGVHYRKDIARRAFGR
jgi:phosphoribosylamine--glycine ligase